MKILILGGYGTFGGNLARLLAKHEKLTLLIAGRSVSKAKVLCESLPAGAKSKAVFFDRDANVESQIREIQPDIVVDAMGPYQVYGDDPYRVVKACLALGIPYMDLADGSDFVQGISQFDAQAKAGNLFILSGVSTCPVLTSAVTRKLSKGMAKVRTIRAGIAPSPYAGVGLNVVRAITAYAGKQVKLLRNGEQASGYALTESMRYTISPPGHLPLDNILFSLVDVPDLQLLPAVQPGLDSIWFGAGPVPEVLHRMLIGLSWLVRWKILPTLLPFASLFHFVLNTARWGEHRGGMFVSVQGEDGTGKQIERSWHLVAEKGDGPFIPSMAIAAITRNILAGTKPAAGARPATHELELDDYEVLFNERAIHTGMRESDEVHAPLYERILGPAFEALPLPLKNMHNMAADEKIAEGLANVETGNNPLARLIHAAIGFPKAGRDLPVRVIFQPKNGGELWLRDFAGKKFSSFQWEGRGRSERLILEKFGPVTVALALIIDKDKLRIIVRRCNVFGIPIPLFLAPNGETYEYVDENGFFCFHVEIKLFPVGPIVRYQGRLAPAD
jgi:uncharacterized protein YbjT (DUF2867 family)